MNENASSHFQGKTIDSQIAVLKVAIMFPTREPETCPQTSGEDREE
jgi:hypothetical protein